MASSKLAKSQDPWERLEELVAETSPDAPENSFTLAEVSARKGWAHRKAYFWLRAQVAAGKILKHGQSYNTRYYFPPK